ncbi:MAG TPA: hypothetical protein VHU40_17535, partial [Polyangia bacterium]|nr:hypothetical protein [Polyangia bacterium]
MIWLRSWFSITIVKTDPVHCGGRAAGAALIALQARSVLPALFGAQAVPARAAADAVARRAAVLRMNARVHTDRGATSVARCSPVDGTRRSGVRKSFVRGDPASRVRRACSPDR